MPNTEAFQWEPKKGWLMGGKVWAVVCTWESLTTPWIPLGNFQVWKIFPTNSPSFLHNFVNGDLRCHSKFGRLEDVQDLLKQNLQLCFLDPHSWCKWALEVEGWEITIPNIRNGWCWMAGNQGIWMDLGELNFKNTYVQCTPIFGNKFTIWKTWNAKPGVKGLRSRGVVTSWKQDEVFTGLFLVRVQIPPKRPTLDHGTGEGVVTSAKATEVIT